MSITGAVAELNKEIDRLTAIRDSLLKGSPETSTSVGVPAAVRKTARKKTAGGNTVTASKKTATAKSVPVKKRMMSPEARKRISEATKKRWAAIRKAKETK